MKNRKFLKNIEANLKSRGFHRETGWHDIPNDGRIGAFFFRSEGIEKVGYYITVGSVTGLHLVEMFRASNLLRFLDSNEDG